VGGKPTGRIRTRQLRLSGSGETENRAWSKLAYVSEQAVEARAAEAEAVATLHRLNAEYIRAFVESDVEWYRDNLSDEFVCSLADGRRIGKAEFLELNGADPGVSDLTYDQVDVRPIGEVALVHGVTHWTRDGEPGSTRYTDVWRLSEGGWLAVAAHLTPVRSTQRAGA
jgi:ketosteroid isomerase-like protein